MSSDRLDRPPWYSPPERERVTHGPSPAVDAPRSWVRPAPVYYHDAPDGTETIAAPTLPPAHEVPQPLPESSPSPGDDADPEAQEEAPLSARRLPRRAMVATLVAAFAVAGTFLGVSQFFGALKPSHAISAPAKIGGSGLIAGSANVAVQSLTAQGWTSVAGGGYGSGAGQFLLLVGRPPPAASEDGAFLNALKAPLVQLGYVFNTATSATIQAGGGSFICGPASAASGQVTLCTWTDGDAAGVLIDYSGATLAQTRDLAQQARSAAEH